MTTLGLQYLQHKEVERHNLMEEAYKRSSLSETVRSNKANEDIKRQTLDESIRHNIATEQYSLANLAEQSRHNRVNESLQSSQLAETIRKNSLDHASDNISWTVANRDLVGNSGSGKFASSLSQFMDNMKDFVSFRVGI